MRYYLYILLLFLGISSVCFAQNTIRTGERDGSSFTRGSGRSNSLVDSALLAMKADSIRLREIRIQAKRLTPYLGDPYLAPMDTNRLNTANNTLAEARSTALSYLANLGAASQSRIFSERKESSDFIFKDVLGNYIVSPETALFYDTRSPYTQVLYTMGGSSQAKEEQFKGVLTLNFGKKINVGGDFDYIYSRGHYNSNSNKSIMGRIFGSYNSDKYNLNSYVSFYRYTGFENGGLTNDLYITRPDDFIDGRRPEDPKAFPVRFTDVTNRLKNNQFFLTHRYNLGFYKETDEFDAEGNPKEVFIPVSSIIHTFEYEGNNRNYRYMDGKGAYTTELDTCYNQTFGTDSILDDWMYSSTIKNTIGLALREGFQSWAKFGLTAFLRLENRKFRFYDESMLEQHPANDGIPDTTFTTYKEFSAYIGAELSKRQGSVLTYNARGELCVIGDDIGEFRISGELNTKFKLLKKDASIRAYGYINNITPAFYMRHNHSRYFWWDNSNFNFIQQFHAGADINIESTETTLSAGLTSVQNYTYFGENGYPIQADKNIQVISAKIKQDFHYRALGWENEAVYQLSSDKEILPLPSLSLKTNLYVAFKLAKVMTVQLGAEAYYYTAYRAPYYEPATQQFINQSEVKIGNSPLINAYMNCHLKQARFFLMAYNIGSQIISPNYFSAAHYPLNPMYLKLGIAVTFKN